jgi:hypothetical protein
LPMMPFRAQTHTCRPFHSSAALGCGRKLCFALHTCGCANANAVGFELNVLTQVRPERVGPVPRQTWFASQRTAASAAPLRCSAKPASCFHPLRSAREQCSVSRCACACSCGPALTSRMALIAFSKPMSRILSASSSTSSSTDAHENDAVSSMCWSSRPGVATCACASADPITHAKHLIADAYSLRPARGTMEAPSKWLQLHPSRLTR